MCCTHYIHTVNLAGLMRRSLPSSPYKDEAVRFEIQQYFHSLGHTSTISSEMTKFYEDTEPIPLTSALQSDPPRRKHSSVSVDGGSGWKYRRFFGLPHYASPQTQLVLVAFVCFLCPGTSCNSVRMRYIQLID
jgi:hypothetical protein